MFSTFTMLYNCPFAPFLPLALCQGGATVEVPSCKSLHSLGLPGHAVMVNFKQHTTHILRKAHAGNNGFLTQNIIHCRERSMNEIPMAWGAESLHLPLLQGSTKSRQQGECRLAPLQKEKSSLTLYPKSPSNYTENENKTATCIMNSVTVKQRFNVSLWVVCFRTHLKPLLAFRNLILCWLFLVLFHK